MTIKIGTDSHWRGVGIEFPQDVPRFDGFYAQVAPQGIHGQIVGVLINDTLITITTARRHAAALLAVSDHAEEVAAHEATRGLGS